MWESKYANAGMDMKKLLLCFIGKIWIVLLAVLLGAVLGGGAYAVSRVVPESKREYQAMSKIYLDFAADETGEVYQAYNGYTWNDLMATDPILDVTMKYLPETYSREDVMGATKAEILSDLRLLTITVTTHDADSCNAILQATGQSLTDRGREAKEFRRIEVIRTTEAALVVADSRLVQAVLIGLVLGAAAALLGMLLYYVLDDRIMVAADLRQVTDVPFVGYGGAGGQLQEEYDVLGLTWTGLYGFSNTYGLALRQETADQYGLATYSDLAAASGELTFGGNPDYIELETGYPRLCEAYQMQFQDVKQMEIALKYEALKNGEVDVINAFTTDAQLAANNLVLLTDDGSFFERFDAGTIVRKDALEKYPKLQGVLEKLNGLISEDEMQQLNYEVEVNGKEDKEVARQFLVTKGLLSE